MGYLVIICLPFQFLPLFFLVLVPKESSCSLMFSYDFLYFTVFNVLLRPGIIALYLSIYF